ncbi:NADAR family protein [Nocardioides sp. CCNWLW239]|uniref:NADAR family protein n=1 Tax=Nocardioides sp. CCNWLW239 TaxID=3128902 RepID=UPI003018E8C7
MKPEESRSRDELVAAVDAGARPKYVHFWGHTPRRPGKLDKSCFSQWFPAPFDADGERFATAEHYMMWSKAVLFGDHKVAAEILAAPTPGAAKALGRMVAGFSETAWVSRRSAIVISASIAKFGSNPMLRDFLLATGDRVLVEASPHDPIWGIGMAESNPAAATPSEWRGLNLLGFALIEARTQLA